jgi:hypothetical protein
MVWISDSDKVLTRANSSLGSLFETDLALSSTHVDLDMIEYDTISMVVGQCLDAV